jgi:hypothetical protein
MFTVNIEERKKEMLIQLDVTHKGNCRKDFNNDMCIG